ncbi:MULTISPECIES: metal-sulfur cluster assembly factor [unclassified Burkholderia]|uniref:metal-sulfur cluster assembly factor n=1 Tax=unclassified Burkholderia TaxID=2613784 RepID=UPI00075DC11C|nr:MULTISPECIES: metal-sulfur cluster assembly factor [unclassified Burkholderia]KVN05410.1 hydroxylase [Burkholderia sp. MSMB1552]KWZ56423.1 hydroxylase [Burkholderia sp. MSMB1588]
MPNASAIRSETPDELALRDALREVIDPEIGVNIVDLGLVYRIERTEERIVVTMTMTSPACPMAGVVIDDVQATLGDATSDALPVDVNLVWEPPWAPKMMSDAAREQMGWPIA